jgi:hypothetical protein
MPKYEIAVAVATEDDIPGHKRKDEGDIIAIVKSPHVWGKKEVDEFIIVPIELKDDIGTLKRKLQSPATNGGMREYKIDLATLKTKLAEVDLAKVRDKKTKYQPFLKSANVPAGTDCGTNPSVESSVGKDPADVIVSKTDGKTVDISKKAEVG